MKITVEMAARILQKSNQFVRVGLQRKLLPFGFAVRIKEDNRSRHDYFINPKDFAEYVGISLNDLRDMGKRVAN